MNYDPNQINDLATWVALSAAIPFVGYLFTYGVGSPWYRSLLGWVMFALGLSISLVLSFNTIRRVHGEFPGYEWWALGIYSFLTVVGYALWAIVIVERRRAPLLLIPLKKENRKMKVPEIWYKAQRVLRTAVATLISALTAWAAFVVIWPDVAAQLATILPESWVAWLVGAVAVITAVASAISRIMAIPAVNSWLTKWLNLGSAPKSALAPVGKVDGKVVVAVEPDPKVLAHEG